MTSEVAFLLVPLSVAVAGSVLLWLLARARRRRRLDSVPQLWASGFRYRDGSAPRRQPSGIVTTDNPSEEE